MQAHPWVHRCHPEKTQRCRWPLWTLILVHLDSNSALFFLPFLIFFMKIFIILSVLTLALTGCNSEKPSSTETSISPSIPTVSESSVSESSETESTPSYYDELAKTCTSTGEVTTCCVDSIEVMRKWWYKEKVGEMCPSGLEEYSQECPGAKVWCAALIKQ